ncbi:MAG: hypothetical protein IPL61_00630 [Myxococcales bacterium]|nr:hypothetical protein [Myxococcales bacterium]
MTAVATPSVLGLRAFFTAAIGSALALGMATPDDVLTHTTPEVLATHLPRAEWTKLLTACLAAPRTDARLVVDTITVPVLCEHIPLPILWACLAQIAARGLGRGLVAPPPAVAAAKTPTAVAAVAAALAPAAAPTATAATAAPTRASTSDERTAEVARLAPTPPAPPAPPAPAAPLPAAPVAARPTSGDNGARTTRSAEPPPLGDPPAPPRSNGATPRTTLGVRRPQAAAAMSHRKSDPRPAPGRASTATDFEIETDLGEAWKKEPEPVDEDQLIDWSQSEETQTGSEGLSDRKR